MTYYEGKLFRDENGKVYFNDIDGEGFILQKLLLVVQNPQLHPIRST